MQCLQFSNPGYRITYIRTGESDAITNKDTLVSFLSTRSSHVAQTSLYGYLRTRAGTRFPEMFENPDILISINIARWHIWLACVSDLCIFAGQCMYQSGSIDEAGIRELLPAALQQLLNCNALAETLRAAEL